MERSKVLTTTPSFVVSDLQKSLDFYTKLGFGSPSVWGEPPCFAMLDRGGFELMLTVASKEGQVRPNGPDGVWDMYIRVADVSMELVALKQAGVEIARRPEKTFYHMIEMEVIDPDGHRICFGQDAGVG